MIRLNHDVYETARKVKNLRHLDVSIHLRITPQALISYRNGMTPPSVKILMALSELLDVPWESLVEKVEENPGKEG